MNENQRWKAAQRRRVARGMSRLVPVEDLQPGNVLLDFNMSFSHLEPGANENVVLVKFSNGLGYTESKGAEVEVTRQ